MCTTQHIFYPYRHKRRSDLHKEETLTCVQIKKWRRNSHEKKSCVVHKIGACKFVSNGHYICVNLIAESAQIESYLSNRMLWVKWREILRLATRKFLLREGILLAEVIVTFVTRKVRIVTNVTVIDSYRFISCTIVLYCTINSIHRLKQCCLLEQ